jgi:cytochrome subunit of sulfide dehydrogenase
VNAYPNKLLLLVALPLFSLFYMAPTTASAQDAATRLQIRALAASCASCHGTEGRVAAGSLMPALAGMPQERLAAQMKEFQSGTRPATIMHQISKGYTDEQIARMAAYFAALKP